MKVDGNGNPVALNANEYIPFRQIRDALGRAVFGTNASSGDSIQQDELYQMFIGLSPDTTKMWIRDPITVPRMGLDVVPCNPDDPAERNHSFLQGFDSPFWNPSLRSERLMSYFQNWDIAFQNDSAVANVCTARVVGYRHRIVPLNPALKGDRDVIASVLTSRMPARLMTMGGIRDPVKFQSSAGPWAGISPIPLTTDAINAVKAGVA
jgi:hypothetical protein